MKIKIVYFGTMLHNKSVEETYSSKNTHREIEF